MPSSFQYKFACHVQRTIFHTFVFTYGSLGTQNHSLTSSYESLLLTEFIAEKRVLIITVQSKGWHIAITEGAWLLEVHRLCWSEALKRQFLRKHNLPFKAFLCFYLEKIIFVSQGVSLLIDFLHDWTIRSCNC